MLSLTAQIAPSHMLLTYRLLHTLPEPIFVLDRPGYTDAGPPAHACHAGGAWALFMHGICPRPPSAPYPPYQSVLAHPGSTRVAAG